MQDSPCRATPLAAPGRKAGCFTPAVMSRGAGPQGTVLTDVTPPTYKEPGRKDGCQRCRQPTHEVQAARRGLTVLAIVDKQRAQPQGRAHVRQQSTALTRPQGTVHGYRQVLRNQPRGSVMGTDSLVTAYSGPAIHNRSGIRAARRLSAPRSPILPAARAV